MPTFILEELDPVDRPDLQYKGVSYPAALPDDFGLDTEAKVKRILTQLQTWQERPDNQQKARKLMDLAGDVVEIYFPTMPAELRDKIPLMKKLDIIRWWGEVVYPPRMAYLMEIRRLRQDQIA